jgi:DNA polymerase I-like protein with 3'-5' exonuclease and polymerase domains
MGYHELAIKIKSEIQEGYFRNHYGRKLKNSSSNINHYLQSTGVDVSMMCFSKINSVLKSANMNFKIIGFIHDAMIIDADKSSADKITNNLNKKNIGIPGFNNKFPIIITEVK